MFLPDVFFYRVFFRRQNVVNYRQISPKMSKMRFRCKGEPLSDSAFQAEIFRAGIQSIDKGQYEASHSISLRYRDTMRFVILPQAIRRILPALGNQLVYMLKMSSLVSVIGMQELTRKANELVVTEYRPLEIYTILVLEYLVLILVVSAGVRWLEHRLKSDERV